MSCLIKQTALFFRVPVSFACYDFVFAMKRSLCGNSFFPFASIFFWLERSFLSECERFLFVKENEIHVMMTSFLPGPASMSFSVFLSLGCCCESSRSTHPRELKKGNPCGMSVASCAISSPRMLTMMRPNYITYRD